LTGSLLPFLLRRLGFDPAGLVPRRSSRPLVDGHRASSSISASGIVILRGTLL